jgi:cell wall-associated NlpC family hydrolase
MTQAARAAVVAEARGWLGTRYHHHGRIRGVGVDCAMLLAEVYERCGVAPHVDPGSYPTDWHLHRSEEQFLGWLDRVGAREIPAPAAGDIGLFKFGRCFSHGAIVVDLAGQLPQLVHAYVRRGVVLTALDEEPLSGRPVRWFTLWPKADA